MLHQQHKANFEKRATNTVAFMTSFVIHVVVLLIAASLAFSIGKNSHGVMIEAEIGDSQEVGFDLVDVVAIEPTVEPQPAMQLEEISSPSPLDNLTVAAPGISQPANDSNTIDATLASSTIGGNGNDDGEGLSRSLAATVKKRGAAFFGAYAEGKRFVFVLDSSRSMQQDDRWTYACNQLIDSLNGLLPEQEFYVICFDIKTSYLFNVPPSREKFFKADDKTLVRVKRWLRSHELGRATMPSEALQNALALQPDAVFLLSDGELQDGSLEMLRMINGFSPTYRQIPIHTIHLFSADGRETLKLIARENSGTFTPVQNN